MIEYLVDLNATLAAVRAGYSEKTANEQGERLLSTNSVKEQIAKEMDRLLQNTGVNQDQVIRELAKVAFYSVPDIDGQNEAPLNKNIKNEDKVETPCVKPKKGSNTIEKEIRFADKLKALELLGKHFGMFSDNASNTGNVGVQIVNDIPKGTG